MPERQRPELIHVADPLCSWCYGFGPELARILDATALPLRLVMAGLFAGERAQAVEGEWRAYLDTTWRRVGELSGLEFDRRHLERGSWRYDSALACRAVVAVRSIASDRTFAFFNRLQGAFYAGGLDLSAPAAYRRLAGDAGLDPLAVASALHDRAIADATTADFAEASELSAGRGLPLLVLDIGEEKIVVASGHNPAQNVVRSIQAFTAR